MVKISFSELKKRNCTEKRIMSHISTFAIRLAILLIVQAAGAGWASPTVLVTRPIAARVEWLPNDNQTVYVLEEGERRSLELNTSLISRRLVYITITPCSREIHWSVYQGSSAGGAGHLSLLKEYTGQETSVFSVIVSEYTRYVLQLSAPGGGAVAVSVRGEVPRPVRMRLRVRSRRRISVHWDTSPIDPQETTYCVVASRWKNYTSLCVAQYDAKINNVERKVDPKPITMNALQHKDLFKPSNIDIAEKSYQFDSSSSLHSMDVDNKIETDIFNIYRGTKNEFRRKKFGGSTKAAKDPVVACVGERTHHFIENLDPSLKYFVSVFAIAKDRMAGSLLATGSVNPRATTAKRLKENVPMKADVRGKAVYYFKTSLGLNNGIWVAVTTCGGAVDVDVLLRGKRIYFAKNIDPQWKFFVPAVVSRSSSQETSDEAVQFDSSSEEMKMRYVIKVIAQGEGRAVGVELTASTTRWGVSSPELMEDGATVRELRPRRSCRSVDVAFLPAVHNATDVIRYCITAKESSASESYTCSTTSKKAAKTQCLNHIQRPPARVIVQKVTGLKPGRKYSIQVTAANKGSLVPYKILFADTNVSCKET